MNNHHSSSLWNIPNNPLPEGPTIDSGICRYCGLLKKCRVLNANYPYNGNLEVYSEMIHNCFGIVIQNLHSEERCRLVCANCVMRLREAISFRIQVANVEQRLLTNMHGGEYGTNTADIKLDVKFEKPQVPETHRRNKKSLIETVKSEAARARKMLEVFSTVHAPKAGPSRKAPSVRAPTIMYGPEAVLRRKITERMEKMKAIARNRIGKDEPAEQPTKPRRINNKEGMIFENTVNMVRYSYICPFNNIIGTYHCFYCKKTFIDPEELRHHTMTHDTKHFSQHWPYKKNVKIDITRIDCRLCDLTIDTLPSLKLHLKDVHNKYINTEIDNEFLKFKLKNDNLECLECGSVYMFIDKLIEHMSVHFGYHICDICGNSFVQQSSLEAHMRCHKKNLTPFPCPVCKKNLRSNRSRSLHIAVVHEKKPVIKCFKCEKKFLSYERRDRHLIDDHGDKRSFTCRTCGKVFSMRKQYVSHNRVAHEKSFKLHKCDVCPMVFNTRKLLTKHAQSHIEVPNQTYNIEAIYSYPVHLIPMPQT